MPSAPVGRLGKIFRQCQKCHKTDDDLKSCSRCRRSHYCSTECQKADWPDHKPICNANSINREKMKEADAARLKKHPNQEALTLHETSTRLKKWVQVYKPILQIAVINALHLQRTPEQCQTHLLYVVIKPTFSTASQALSIPIPNSFQVVDGFVESIAETSKLHKEKNPEITELLTRLTERSRAIHADGGVGVALVNVYVQDSNFMQITPFGMPELVDNIAHDNEWLISLTTLVAMGKVI